MAFDVGAVADETRLSLLEREGGVVEDNEVVGRFDRDVEGGGGGVPALCGRLFL